MSWKKSALVRSKILGLFVNTLTAEYTYSRRNMQSLTSSDAIIFKTTSSDAIIFKTKDFFEMDLLLPFWYLHEMENIFKKKESLLASKYFRKLTPKEVGYLSAWKALLQNSFL